MPRRISRRVRIALLAILIICAAAGIFTYWSYRQEIQAARARVSSGSKVVETPCGIIEYAEEGQGPAVLIIHGAGGGFDQGLDFARMFGSSGFRIIAPSRFGYLRTPLPSDASPAAQADAHACLLDTLRLQRVAVVGGSAGAPSAMQLCLRHPQRCSGLVLLFPLAYAPRPEGEAQQPPSRLAQFVMDTTLDSDFAFWLATKMARDTMIETILATPIADFNNAGAGEQARALDVLRNILPVSQRANGLRNENAVVASLERYDLERITVPTLIVCAENDGYGMYRNARYTAEHIPGARLVSFPTGGHLLLGHREEARTALRELLTSH
jgi:pimeloyl-ACP methyl ester carboxylesterase